MAEISGPPTGVRHRTPQYSPRYIAYVLKLAASGRPVAYVCRQLGVSRTVFYAWRKKYPLASFAD